VTFGNAGEESAEELADGADARGAVFQGNG
jgi:hypothetical protein